MNGQSTDIQDVDSVVPKYGPDPKCGQLGRDGGHSGAERGAGGAETGSFATSFAKTRKPRRW
jgi:hypothetical protein